MLSFRAKDLDIEGSYYIGTVLSTIMYGIYFGVYCLSISALLANKNTTRLHRHFYMWFSNILLLLNTFSFVQLPYVGQMAWIVIRDNYPGGPLAYIFESDSIPVDLACNLAQTLAVTLNDGLLVYRCYVVFGSRLYIVIFPVLCSLTYLALGVALIPLDLHPEPQYLDKINAATIALNTAVNVMVTAMISIKILSVSRILRKSVDSTQAHAVRTYTNVVAILIESAAPCATLGILSSIGCFMSPSSTSPFSLDIEAIYLPWLMSLVLFPQLIIYRIASGSAWTERTSQELTRPTGSLAFAPREMRTTISSSESNAITEGNTHTVPA